MDALHAEIVSWLDTWKAQATSVVKPSRAELALIALLRWEADDALTAVRATGVTREQASNTDAGRRMAALHARVLGI